VEAGEKSRKKGEYAQKGRSEGRTKRRALMGGPSGGFTGDKLGIMKKWRGTERRGEKGKSSK